jgi:hypothetical protein
MKKAAGHGTIGRREYWVRLRRITALRRFFTWYDQVKPRGEYGEKITMLGI